MSETNTMATEQSTMVVDAVAEDITVFEAELGYKPRCDEELAVWVQGDEEYAAYLLANPAPVKAEEGTVTVDTVVDAALPIPSEDELNATYESSIATMMRSHGEKTLADYRIAVATHDAVVSKLALNEYQRKRGTAVSGLATRAGVIAGIAALLDDRYDPSKDTLNRVQKWVRRGAAIRLIFGGDANIPIVCMDGNCRQTAPGPKQKSTKPRCMALRALDMFLPLVTHNANDKHSERWTLLPYVEADIQAMRARFFAGELPMADLRTAIDGIDTLSLERRAEAGDKFAGELLREKRLEAVVAATDAAKGKPQAEQPSDAPKPNAKDDAKADSKSDEGSVDVGESTETPTTKGDSKVDAPTLPTDEGDDYTEDAVFSMVHGFIKEHAVDYPALVIRLAKELASDDDMTADEKRILDAMVLAGLQASKSKATTK